MNRTSENCSISQQLDEIKKDDEAAIAALWDRCYPALAKFAEKRIVIIGIKQRAFNGEDVAASAMLSFFRAVKRNRFPVLDSEDGLFLLLKSITLRKVIDRKRKNQTLKAGSGEGAWGISIWLQLRFRDIPRHQWSTRRIALAGVDCDYGRGMPKAFYFTSRRGTSIGRSLSTGAIQQLGDRH